MKRLAAAAIAITLSTSPSIVLAPPRPAFSKWKEVGTSKEHRHKIALAVLHEKGRTVALLPDRVEFRRKGAHRTYVPLDKTAIGGAVLDAGAKALAVFPDGSIELLRFSRDSGVSSGTLRLEKNGRRFMRALAGGHKENYWIVFPETSEYYIMQKLRGKKWGVSKPKKLRTVVPDGAKMECSASGCEIRLGRQVITKLK